MYRIHPNMMVKIYFQIRSHNAEEKVCYIVCGCMQSILNIFSAEDRFNITFKIIRGCAFCRYFQIMHFSQNNFDMIS